MLLVGIGDLFIPAHYIEEGMKELERYGIRISAWDWKVKDFDELQRINLLVEQGGCEQIEIPDEIMNEAEKADILITQFFPVGKKMIDSCKKLKYIGILRSGVENVNVEYAKQKGVTVFHAVGRNAHAVSDFTIGLMICEARNIARGHEGMKKGLWIREYSNSNSIPDLYNKTVGIVGYGEIGKLVAQKLSGFDVQILIHDPFYKENEMENVDLDELMRRSDFITIHARLTEENVHMIGEKEIGLMKSTAYLINTSRAGLVDEKALYHALKEKHIAGAAIDVYSKEPPEKNYPFLALDNVTLTPHMAGGSRDAFFNTPRLMAKEIAAFMQGENTRFLL